MKGLPSWDSIVEQQKSFGSTKRREIPSAEDLMNSPSRRDSTWDVEDDLEGTEVNVKETQKQLFRRNHAGERAKMKQDQQKQAEKVFICLLYKCCIFASSIINILLVVCQ